MSSSIVEFHAPFVDVGSFETPREATIRRLGLSSPFIEAFAYDDSSSGAATRDAVRRVLHAELYDEELDEAIYELVGETASSAINGADPQFAASTARLKLTPLADEIEDYVQRVAAHFGDRDASVIAEGEIDEAFSRVGAQLQPTPGFEHLFGGIVNAVKKAAKGAANLAKKGLQAAARFGLGPILQKLSLLVRPLLERVLKAAIHRLPVAVQPAARRLATKLPALFGHELESESDDESPAIDISAIQSEFNERAVATILGESMLGETEPLDEAETSSWRETHGEEASIGDLDTARERFVAELETLSDGEDPGPAIEQFIPALLPVLKLGLKLAGRQRVVNTLSGLVAKLIGRFTGPQASKPLSTALVDAGLKLIGLEVTEADQRKVATSALAATVEETVRRVAALPDAVLDNEALLEGSIVRSFEEAAAANLPPVLPAAIYRRRPELIETDSRHGSWVSCPVRGPKRYKKFTRVVRTRITPHAAMTVTTFGEAPLAQYLQEQLEIAPGEELEAHVHLYESLPGTVLGEVAHIEGANEASAADFHPLTQEAAALLLHEPGLGRAMSAASRSAPNRLGVGHRFYRIVVPGRRVATIRGMKGQRRRRTRLYTVLDFSGDRIRLYLFLGERRAQEMAATLRKQGHIGSIATALRGFIDRGLNAASTGSATGRVRVIHEGVSLQQARGAALGKVPSTALKAFMAQLGVSTLTALTNFFASNTARFVAATEDSKDGVTLVITIANPPNMGAIRSAIAGTAPSAPATTSAEPSSMNVEVVPGFTNG